MDTKHYLRLLRTFALATLTAAAVAACSDDTDTDREPLTPPDGNGGIPVTFSANINPGSDANPAGAPGTRTVLTPTANGGFTVEWKGRNDHAEDDYDFVRIWAAKENTLIGGGGKRYVPTTSGASSALEPKDDSEKLTLTEPGEWKFTAVYGTFGFWNDMAFAVVSPRSQSKPGNNEHIAAADFSIATATQNIAAENDEMSHNINLKFKHMLSALQLQVKNGTSEALTVNEIRLSVKDDQIACQRKYDIAMENWKADGEQKEDYLELKITNPEALATGGASQNFYTLLFPEPRHSGKDMTITIITDHGEYTLTKTAPAGGFAAGTNYLTDITIQSSNLTSKETWTEYVNISTAEELTAFRDNVNNGTDNCAGKIVRLLNDITLTGTWAPIGTGGNPFSGTFDGGGHHIEGLNAACSNKDFVGLFGYIKDGTVRNLRVSGTVTVSGSLGCNYVGGIVGQLNNSTVENCIFSGGTVSGKERVGGIAGYSWDNSRIAGCYTKGRVTATMNSSGGIAGENSSNSTITDCYSEAVVEAKLAMAGGIAGQNYGSSITNCYATGAVGTPDQGGGIAGQTSNGTITGCIALNPSLTKTSGSSTSFGGIAGWNYNNSTTINNCGAYKDMTITDNSGNTVTPDDATVVGDDLTREQCLTKTTYTDRGFKTDNNGWGFDNLNTPWTYLPWIRAFEFFSDITNADEYRISVPDHLKGTGTVN